ncbi:MAG: hypothetical protein O7G30_06490 [Proteobacteria bacterium]|nr:hypothetical protein [Pseudomonadota bacterium]
MKTRIVLASAAAALFTAGFVGSAGADSHEGGEAEKVKCEGANSCSGKSECKTAHSECGGKNSCKGKGWIYLSAEECEKAKAPTEG